MPVQYNTVAELLADPKRWTKREMARSADGLTCPPDSPSAVKFCLIGGLRRVYMPKGYHCYRLAMQRVRDVISHKWWGPSSFNDDPQTTHAAVLKVCKAAKV